MCIISIRYSVSLEFYKIWVTTESMIYARGKLFAPRFSIRYVSRVSSSERYFRGSGRSESVKSALAVDPQREKGTHPISVIFALDALIFRRRPRWMLFGSSGFLLPGCFSAGQVSSYAEAFDCTGSVAAVVEDPFHAPPRIAALKKTRSAAQVG